jgi:hypothetical protein
MSFGRKSLIPILLVFLAGAKAGSTPLSDAELSKAVATIKQVSAKGAGHEAAQAAWQTLARADAVQLPAILSALDDAGPLAANWLRAGAEVVVGRQLASGGQLPAAQLEAFATDRRHAPRSRRLAYEWLVRIDPAASDRLLPKMLDDPSLELRRDAVARLLDQAQAKTGGDAAQGLKILELALASARDLDQIRAAIEQFGNRGVKIDLAKTLGFIQRWKVVGPFDNVGGRGFAAVYPPEQSVDPKAKYEGKEGPLTWQEAKASDDMGHVDLNLALGQHKGAVAYCYAELKSPVDQPIELRLGTEAANKIWLNGKLLEDTEVYHALTDLDQYVGRGELKRGTNQILLKICQNEQTEDWAANWKFQIRACDATGGALDVTEVTP